MYLKISDLNVSLGGMSILQDVNLHTNKGELVVVVGSNGAGKSTLVRTICGLNKCQTGVIEFDGKQIQNLEPYAVAAAGISRVPEGRQLFSAMTVRENLEIGAYSIRRDKKRVEENIEKVYTMFPVLKKYENRIASTFSGGEQQMLAVGRALMCDPKILLMDEMSLGLAPIVIERGDSVEERQKAVLRFQETGKLDTDSNIQFGEGGAGAFSDGKLNSGINDPRAKTVLHELVAAGAPEEILWEAKPHIGTDRLPQAVKGLRQEIIRAGGEVRFRSRLTDLRFTDGVLSAVKVNDEWLATDTLILCAGHSARELFALLYEKVLTSVKKFFLLLSR